MPNLYKRRRDLGWQLIDEKAVVVDDAEGKVFHLNAVGTEIWKGLEEALTEDQIVKNLTDCFDQKEDAIRRDTNKFLKELCKLDLIQKENA